ncbi:MAG TPA: MFS transporter [Jatrophihabitans sp.]|nr:MFS transporter [Jatrophihabitans sp.]
MLLRSPVDDSAATPDLRRARTVERNLLIAAFITTAGSAFQITAAAILVFRSGQSTLSVGWLFIAVSIPQVALSVLFGKLVDKVDRRMLSVVADLASALAAFALPVWLWLGGPATLGAYAANFLLACSATLFMPASNALVKERVRDERLGRYNSHFEMATNAGMLLASSLAGFLIVSFGATPLFIFNAITFVASAVLTYLIGRKPKVAAPPVAEVADDGPAEAPRSRLAQRRRPPIRRLAILYTSGNINLMVANVILTALILQTFHKGAWLIGVVDALAGLGFIVGAATYGKLSARFHGLELAVLCSLVCAVTIALEPTGYIVLMAVIPFAGFFFANFRIAARTLLMQASPAERAGRIFGGAQAFGLALGIAATVGLSVLADRVSVPVAFWALAVIVGGIAVASYAGLAGARAETPGRYGGRHRAERTPAHFVPATATRAPQPRPAVVRAPRPSPAPTPAPALVSAAAE